MIYRHLMGCTTYIIHIQGWGSGARQCLIILQIPRNTNIDVDILTEIGERNQSIVENLMANFVLFFTPAVDNNWVGFIFSKSSSRVTACTLSVIFIIRMEMCPLLCQLWKLC